jgi:multiple sugar transport system substrate-binding protein
MWNKQAFRDAGLDPERPPRTLQELRQYAVRLTKFDRHGEIVRLGLMLPDTTLLCNLHGGDFVDPKTGAITANMPENVRALDYYRSLVEAMGGRGRVDAFGTGYGETQGPNNPFFVGKTAMMLSGEWIPSWIEKYAPKLEYGVAPVPYDTRRPDRKGTTSVSVNLLAIPSEAKHPKEAWEFLRWLQTPYAQTEFSEALNNVPNIRAVLTRPELTEGSPRRRNFGRFCRIAQNPNARGFPITPVGQIYQDELAHATEYVLFGVKSPQRALDDVQTKVSRELAKRMKQ